MPSHEVTFLLQEEHKTLDDHNSTTIRTYSDQSTRRLLSTPLGVRGGISEDCEVIKNANIKGIIFPWYRGYQLWWYLTVIGALLTAFVTPYQIAFEDDNSGILKVTAEYFHEVLEVLFFIDIIIKFNLAFYKDEQIVINRRQIAREYCRYMFWIDLIGVLPFEKAACSIGNTLEMSNEITLLMVSIARSLRFVRLYRLKKSSEDLRFDARLNLLTFTLLRDFIVIMISCHMQACTMYFLARMHNFDKDTWLYPMNDTETDVERYVTALYMTITTFCTVGYGDFAPVNLIEKIFGSFFMILNVVIGAYVIGSVTLLMLSGDEKTRSYRESLEALHSYSRMHGFDEALINRLKRQLRLEFNNREISDEQVLKFFPSAVRRKILQRLYKDHLAGTTLMDGVRPHFIDAFLSSCKVEIFSPGEEIIERGSIQTDLFLLVGGIAHLSSHDLEGGGLITNKLEAGEFIGEIGFFTESAQIHTVKCVSVCKTLTMNRSTYKVLSNDHPGSMKKILTNLLAKVERSTSKQTKFPIPMNRNESIEWYNSTETQYNEAREFTLTAVEELVKMQIQVVHDEEVTRFLFASSRGDTRTVSLMLENGFDANQSDYDDRTALMIAAMKGNVDIVRILLQYNACPNKVDMHGSTALLEATKHGNEEIMSLLFEYGAKLCLSESQAASILCQAVFDGNILLIKRLLKAGINVNACDYDKRNAAHISAAEGNLPALRVLAAAGADLSAKDRWGNECHDEAERSQAKQVLVFLEKIHNGD